MKLIPFKVIFFVFCTFIFLQSENVFAQINFSSQCTGPTVDGVQTDCTHANDSEILQQQCVPLFGAGGVCRNMSLYLSELTRRCRPFSSSEQFDCISISANGIYGSEASRFATYFITARSASGDPNSSSPGSAGTTTSAGSPGILDLPTGFGLPDPQGGIKEVLSNLLKWFLGIIGIIAMIAFVVSGAQYFLASGDEKMATTAKKNMTYSIIGMVVALSGYVIIKAVDAALNARQLF